MDDLEKQFKDIIKEYRRNFNQEVQDALTEAGDFMKNKLKDASPEGDSIPHFKDCWVMKTKYINVRYIGNSKMVSWTPSSAGKKGTPRMVPLSTILEITSKGKSFIAKTYETNKNEMFKIFFNKLGGKN